jgi:hypothetical protein
MPITPFLHGHSFDSETRRVTETTRCGRPPVSGRLSKRRRRPGKRRKRASNCASADWPWRTKPLCVRSSVPNKRSHYGKENETARVDQRTCSRVKNTRSSKDASSAARFSHDLAICAGIAEPCGAPP